MKTLRLIIALLVVGIALGSNAQVTRRTDGETRKKDKKEGAAAITDRQQSFYEVREPSDADLQWMKVIYRSIDLTKDKNPALYYPEEPNADGENLFFIIMRLLAKNQISAYEYLDGREMFTEEFKVKVGEMMDRFHIYYTEAKNSTAKNPIYEFENADIPSNEVLSYYIIEKWEFDTRSNQMKARVEALCPVLHRMDEWGGEAVKYPMFWVKLNDIRPYMAQQYVFTDDDNNLARYSLDDFFKLNMYSGEIYKTKNLRNQSLRQLYPEEEAYKHAQDSIEQRLRSFNQDLWVPPLEVLQARAEAEEKARAEAEGELEEGEEGAEQVEGEATTSEGEEKSVTRTTKRGSKSSSKSSTTKKSSKSKTKDKKTKIKERKPKSNNQTVNTGVRSVRNRKK
jgi:gliding motility associated protien GldN